MKSSNLLIVCTAFVVGACGNDGVDPVAEAAPEKPIAVANKPSSQFDGTVTKVGSPFSISYSMIGTPVVGSPVAIELRVTSSIDIAGARISYTIPDDSSMVLHAAQPQFVDAEFAGNEKWFDQRVTVVPMREGRIYLNVAASADGSDGRITTMMAIPLQVGGGGRELEEEGELGTDEDGEAIRILTND